jgi:probable HAF family extracellular repeat protein
MLNRARLYLGVAVCAFAFSNAAQAREFRVIDLGTLGGAESVALAVNDRGHVIGWSYLADGRYRAFLWKDGTMIDLGTLGGEHSWAYAVNNHGVVLGEATTADGVWHPVVWRDGEMTALGTLGGPYSFPWDINDMGHVVGTSQISTGEFRAFLWKDGTMIDLGTLSGFESVAFAVNDSGAVVITYISDGLWGRQTMGRVGLWLEGEVIEVNAPGRRHAGWAINDSAQVVGRYELDPNWGVSVSHPRGFLWAPYANAIDLGDEMWALRINNAGQVAGVSCSMDMHLRAFLWERGEMLDLGSASYGYKCTARLHGDLQARGPWFNLALNDAGQVALIVDTPSGFHAAVWENGTLTDLGTLGGARSAPHAINNAREVVVAGWSETASGETRATLWTTVVPPPSAGAEVGTVTRLVEDLAAGGDLASGGAAALQASLQAAAAQFENGNVTAACNVLNAFVNKVNAQVKSKRLSPAAGQTLVAAAQSVSACY